MVTWVARRGEGDLTLSVGGLYSQTKKHVNWVSERPLSVGDEVHVKIVETSSVDAGRPLNDTAS
jgi:hypothetical protein